MPRAVLICLVTLLMPTLAQTQTQFSSRRYTCPKVPPRSVLQRLNLEVAWVSRIPTQLQKDGLVSFQILAADKKDELLIQTRQGLVQLMDAETGDLKWRSPVGIPYRKSFPAAYNTQTIFVTRLDRLYALNRKTGKHRLFSVGKLSGVPELGYQLLYTPSGQAVADRFRVIVPSGNDVTTYETNFADFQLNLPAIDPASALPDDTYRPKRRIVFGSNRQLIDLTTSKPLILGTERVGFLSDNGTFLSINKFSSKVIYDYKMRGPSSVGMGHYREKIFDPIFKKDKYRDIAYFGSDAFAVYAIDMLSGALDWRYLAGGPITRTPQVTAADVFVTARRRGLARVDRDTGVRHWRNLEANRFLAVNQKFVYATDHRGYLLVLDYVRGRTLARYDIRDFVLPISNTWTDRLYLAAHDGTVLCLRLRANQTPFRPTPVMEEPVVEEPAPKLAPAP